MTLLGSERWVIFCGWVGGSAAFVDLKEINARCGSGFGGIESVLRAFSSRIEANSASAEGRGRMVMKKSCAKGGSLSADGLAAARHLSIQRSLRRG